MWWGLRVEIRKKGTVTLKHASVIFNIIVEIETLSNVVVAELELISRQKDLLLKAKRIERKY